VGLVSHLFRSEANIPLIQTDLRGTADLFFRHIKGTEPDHFPATAERSMYFDVHVMQSLKSDLKTVYPPATTNNMPFLIGRLHS
jgi:hypothetical protein